MLPLPLGFLLQLLTLVSASGFGPAVFTVPQQGRRWLRHDTSLLTLPLLPFDARELWIAQTDSWTRMPAVLFAARAAPWIHCRLGLQKSPAGTTGCRVDTAFSRALRGARGSSWRFSSGHERSRQSKRQHDARAITSEQQWRVLSLSVCFLLKKKN